MKFILALACSLGLWSLNAQPVVKTEISADTIAVGEIVKVTYSIEGGGGKFELPDLSGLPVISGPNTSSSFVYQNGVMKSNQSYSFSLKAIEEGLLYVPQAVYYSQQDAIIIDPIVITVLPGLDKPSKPRSIQQEVAKPEKETKKRETRRF